MVFLNNPNVNNLRVYPFIRERLEKLRAEYIAHTKDKDLANLWQNVRVIDGTTEYIAMDLVEAMALATVDMKGVTYELTLKGDPVPTRYKKISWEVVPNRISSFEIPSAMSFVDCMPRILYGFDDAMRVLKIDNLTLTRNQHGTLFDLWVAEVNGNRAYGNLPGETITHAWGIGKGLWGEDYMVTWETPEKIDPNNPYKLRGNDGTD